jgi:RHS repeat-associated protein
VTALVNASGSVVERYVYDSYGAVTVLTPAWGTLSGSTYGWLYFRQGTRRDTTTGLDDSRARVYSPVLSRFLQTDPSGLAPDVNDYRYEHDGPTGATDPAGLFSLKKAIAGAAVGSTGGALFLMPLPGAVAGAIIAGRESDNKSVLKLLYAEPPPKSGGVPNRYYPPEAYSGIPLRRVAIISDDTVDDDRMTWIPALNTYPDVNSYNSVRKILNRYEDGSIDVLVFSGHTGTRCNARTLSLTDTLGGWDMSADIYALVRKKLSRRGRVIIAVCRAGASPANVKRTVDTFQVPVTVSPGATLGQTSYAPGGAAALAPYYTARPGMTRKQIERLKDASVAQQAADTKKPGSIWWLVP